MVPQTGDASAGMTVGEAMGVAVRCHQSGRLEEAEAIYRQVLSAEPRHAEALHLLGLIACQSGKNDVGAGLIGQAITVTPENAEYHGNLGLALARQGRNEDAVAAYRRAIALQPEYPAAHSNLGNSLCDLGRLDEAVAAFRQAIACNPAYAEAHYNLGNALCRAGDLAGAIAAYHGAIALNPAYVAAHCNLGLALARDSRSEEAIAAYRNAIRISPDFAEAYNNMGNALNSLCRLREAADAFEKAIRLRPDFCEPLTNLAGILTAQGRLGEAIAIYRKVLRVRPDSASSHSDLIFTLHYLPDVTPADLLMEVRKWNQLHAAPLARFRAPHTNDRSPDRRLRIGYVSADLRDHVVGRTLLPCFEAHDRAQFELVCYSGTTLTDPIAARFRRGSAIWRETTFVSDEALAAQIREDRIDILLDLSLHSGHNRLLAFARKPAPVQISWLGYPGSAGLDAIDYHITDPYLEPSGGDGAGYPDEPLRLPACWCCYGAMEASPAPGELPASRARTVTFGSFNNAAKINGRGLAIWARILGGVENSRLLLLSKSGLSGTVLEFFKQRGIASDRVEFFDYYPASPVQNAGRGADSYLRRYHQIDIALDPFPYNGMTTTLDALWMGVPVVALIGAMTLGRASFSLLSNVGLAELAAQNEDEYVRLATELAHDIPRLTLLRTTLRERMKASPLLDAPGFARNLEAAYRTAWQRWCR